MPIKSSIQLYRACSTINPNYNSSSEVLNFVISATRSTNISLIILSILILFYSLVPASYADVSVTQLKAAFLVNFIKFAHFEVDNQKELKICVVEDSQLSNILKESAPNLVASTPLSIKLLGKLDDISACTLVYIHKSQGINVRVDQLVVTDEGGEGIIELIPTGEKMTFGLNFEKLRKSQVTFPAQVMNLAVKLGQDEISLSNIFNIKQSDISHACDYSLSFRPDFEHLCYLSTLG